MQSCLISELASRAGIVAAAIMVRRSSVGSLAGTSSAGRKDHEDSIDAMP